MAEGICFDDLEKANVLAALYNAAKPAFKQMSSYDPSPMTYKEAKQLTFSHSHFSHIKGRILLIIFIENSFNPKLYDKNNGEGAALKVIESLRKTNDPNNNTIRLLHQENMEKAINEVKNKY